MNPKSTSVGGSRILIDDVSMLSNAQSILSLGNNIAPAVSRCVPIPTPDAVTLPLHPEFAYEDGNIEVKTLDHLFWVHEFLLKRFSAFREQITQARRNGITGRLQIQVDSHSGNIVGALQVLYASVFTGPDVREFKWETLIMALRIATFYGCPDMRGYTITELERRFIFAPILRIILSDEFNLPSWEKSAFIELCRRPEPISDEETKVLKLDRLAAISRIREAEQRRKFVELVDKSVDFHGLVDQDGVVAERKLRADAKYTLRYPQLPKCDCRVRDDTRTGDCDRDGSTALVSRKKFVTAAYFMQPNETNDSRFSVVPCQIHEVAPYIISESHALLKQRNELVKSLGDLKAKASSQIPREDKKNFSVEDEISRATWVRKAA